ncbi:ARID DNA-binding domain-containing protein [Tanacetum coccineum]
MLVKRVIENEAFNASRMAEKSKDHGKKVTARTKKERRAKCYICRERGHVFWNCENKKRIAGVELQEETVETTNQNDAEKVKYPEKVHVIADYMIEGTNDETWNEVWYVSSTYKHHMRPRRMLFKRLQYKFKMIGKEENEKKFIFSYGLGDATVKTRDGDMVISNVQYTPEVSLNILSYDLLEEQGYAVKINNNICSLKYMFDEKKEGTEKSQEKETNEEVYGPKDVVSEHNKFLDNYFESIDPKEDCSLVKGLEDLKWDRNEIHDYVDEEYISWNGSLYALKVNSFARFLSFMNLVTKDNLVYKHWEVFSKKYAEMLKWFYLVYLNYDVLDKIPPVIGTIASLQGLTNGEEEAVKDCYKRFIDMTQVYYETAKMPWHKKPKDEVVESSWTASVKDPQGKDQEDAEIEESQNADMDSKTRFGVRLESNEEEEAEEASSTDGNDFEVIA